jgi:hypothetical protein
MSPYKTSFFDFDGSSGFWRVPLPTPLTEAINVVVVSPPKDGLEWCWLFAVALPLFVRRGTSFLWGFLRLVCLLIFAAA